MDRKPIKVRKVIPTDEYTSKTHWHDEKKPAPDVCKDCGGWGTVPNGFDGNPEMCESCDGTGEVV